MHGGVHPLSKLLNPFQRSVALQIETSHLNSSASQMTGFYMESNIGLNWVEIYRETSWANS